jgi:hypothetical protein
MYECLSIALFASKAVPRKSKVKLEGTETVSIGKRIFLPHDATNNYYTFLCATSLSRLILYGDPEAQEQ